MCNMLDVIKFKKFFKKKQWCKSLKIDEKVTSLNVEVHAETFAYQIYFFKMLLCVRLARQNLSRKKSFKIYNFHCYQVIVYTKVGHPLNNTKKLPVIPKFEKCSFSFSPSLQLIRS